MNKNCIGNCLLCGKCKEYSILESFDDEPMKITPREGFGVAIDIGTTTVVLALCDLKNGAVIKRHSFYNPQREFGPDVISRIDAANRGGLFVLKNMINKRIASGLKELKKHCDGEISEVVIAGNTVMTHLLLGFSCQSLGVFPFRPARELLEEYWLFGLPATIVPWFTAFVGGDIMAGLLFRKKKESFLLVDLGTNGEMALYQEGKLLVTASAAGPAFEGAAGCGAGGGASFVITELANLVKKGSIDETGMITEDNIFTQKQVRDLQLAKSAVRSGLEILLAAAGLSYSQVDKVYLAGGIGQAMDIDDAVTIGLIPAKLAEKVIPAGNTSLGGAIRLLLAKEQGKKEIAELQALVNEINLAEHERFNDLFMENMFFGGYV